ncbi:siderophore-iron reductase FhuF [Bacillus sp. DJP31]|uniref:siderophore-iron reductase FhuF n=1 Tax=Bacillus sp. DJP31 TaxID=3409789 RepID=UPI003BB4F179
MTKQTLQTDELEFLVQHYRLSVENVEDPLSFPCKNLRNADFVDDLLVRLNQIYKISEPYVIASQFMKRYSYMLTVPYLYAMSVWDKQIDFAPDKVSFQSFEQDGVWLPKLHLSSIEVTTPYGGSRTEWRECSLKKLFKEHLSPIIEILARQGRVSRQILWENTATYIFWIYESMVVKYPNNRVILDDFNAILNADGVLFGNYSFNPIRKFYTEKRVVPVMDTELRVRKTCCFYNRLPGVQVSCTTCPKTCTIGQKRGEVVNG